MLHSINSMFVIPIINSSSSFLLHESKHWQKDVIFNSFWTKHHHPMGSLEKCNKSWGLNFTRIKDLRSFQYQKGLNLVNPNSNWNLLQYMIMSGSSAINLLGPQQNAQIKSINNYKKAFVNSNSNWIVLQNMTLLGQSAINQGGGGAQHNVQIKSVANHKGALDIIADKFEWGTEKRLSKWWRQDITSQHLTYYMKPWNFTT